MTDAGVLRYGRMAYRGDARRRPLFPFLPGLRIIFGSAGIGIGGVLPIATALVTEFCSASHPRDHDSS